MTPRGSQPGELVGTVGLFPVSLCGGDRPTDKVRSERGLEDRRQLDAACVPAVQVVYCCVHGLSLVGCGGYVPDLGIEARLVVRPDGRAEPNQALVRTGQRALDERVLTVDFAVVDEAAVDGGVVALAEVDEALVELGALVVAGLPLLGNGRANAGGVPRTEVADPAPPSLAGVFALPLLNAPAFDGTLSPFPFVIPDTSVY